MQVVVFLRSWKGVAFGVGAIVMGILAALLAADTGAPRWNLFAAAVLWFTFAFFGGLGLALLTRAASPHPALRTDSTGIMFRSVPFMSGHAPFSNISQVRALSYGAAKYVALLLNDEEEFIRSQPSLLRPALRYVARAGHPTCVILVGVGTGGDHRVISEQLRGAVRAHRKSGAAA